ncbi:MAG: tetratricopeptide repeat protein, partial [Candidatus Margulisbacteria bacterium]|nr:tetratricopeptide repeat protein [Candidatus Margulisiibacteriota bacterium]
MENLLAGMISFGQNDYVIATKHFRHIIQEIVTNPELLEKWDILYIIINSFILAKDYQTALAITDAALNQPTTAKDELYNKRGIIFYRIKKLSKAIEAFKAALVLSPDNLLFMENLADVYLKLH